MDHLFQMWILSQRPIDKYPRNSFSHKKHPPPGRVLDFAAWISSLRRHYPDQVIRVEDMRSSSQPGFPGSPKYLGSIRIISFGCFILACKEAKIKHPKN